MIAKKGSMKIYSMPHNVKCDFYGCRGMAEFILVRDAADGDKSKGINICFNCLRDIYLLTGEKGLIKAMMKHGINGFGEADINLLKKFAARLELKGIGNLDREQLIECLKKETAKAGK